MKVAEETAPSSNEANELPVLGRTEPPLTARQIGAERIGARGLRGRNIVLALPDALIAELEGMEARTLVTLSAMVMSSLSVREPPPGLAVQATELLPAATKPGKVCGPTPGIPERRRPALIRRRRSDPVVTPLVADLKFVDQRRAQCVDVAEGDVPLVDRFGKAEPKGRIVDSGPVEQDVLAAADYAVLVPDVADEDLLFVAERAGRSCPDIPGGRRCSGCRRCNRCSGRCW